MVNNRIEKPIFIIGVARSGTTVFYNLLSTHPKVTWFSNFSNKFHTIPQTALLHRALDVPILGDKIRQNIISRSGTKLTPRPNEGEEIYHELCRVPFNAGHAEMDEYPAEAAKLREVIGAHLKYSGKDTFLSKQTANNRRLHLLNSIFPDAKFIHIVRDGRAVAQSLTKEEWAKDIHLWWLDKTAGQVEGDKLDLFLEYWDRVHGEILETAPIFGSRYFQFRYEDLGRDVHGVFNRIHDFLEWEPDERFMSQLPATLPNMNYKWQKELTVRQKQQAIKMIGPRLRQFGYALE